jgi:hypothetical protein
MTKNIIFLFIAAIALNIGVSFAGELQMQTGMNFDWWQNNQHDRANQFYIPIQVGGQFEDLSVTFLTAYAHTHLNAAGQGAVSMDNFLDSKLGATYRIVGKLPVDLQFGLGFNLPTGTTNLTARQTSLIMDPDLISVNNFGEGFNVNPTVSMVKEWQNWVFGAGLGYLWRGKYDFSSELGLTDFQPGELYTTTGEVRYYFTSDMYARIYGGYSWYGKDTLHGSNFFQEGDVGQYGLGFYYKHQNDWETEAAFRGILRGKVKFQSAPGVLTEEQEDIHGDEYVVDLTGRYFANSSTTLSSLVQYRKITENGYASDSPSFIGARDKVSVGVGATRALTDKLMAEVNIKGFYKHDDETHTPVVLGPQDYTGFTIFATLTSKF